MESEFELLIPIDSLDAVIIDALEEPRYGNGFIEFETKRTPGRVIFQVTNRILGEVGRIKLKAIDPASSWLCFKVKEPKIRQHTEQELTQLRRTNNRDEKIDLILETDKVRERERTELAEKRKRHFDLLIEWLEYCISADLGHKFLQDGVDPQIVMPRQAAGNKRKIKNSTKERAKMFKAIKDANPRLSYHAVAMRAQQQLAEKGQGEQVTLDDVRNAYRAMGWKWERADKVR